MAQTEDMVKGASGIAIGHAAGKLAGLRTIGGIPIMRKFSIGLATCSLLLAGAASAQTASFDDIPNTSNAIQTGTITSGGLSFTGEHYHIIDSADARVVRNGSTSYLAAEAASNLGRPVTFGLTGGGLFSLSSVDVAELWLPNEPLSDFRNVIFTGTQNGGGILTLTFTLDGLRDGAGGIVDLETVLFTNWKNLQSVTVTGRNAAGGFGDFAIDDVVFGAAVPEPSVWALLILGFGITGAALRRRRPARVAFV